MPSFLFPSEQHVNDTHILFCRKFIFCSFLLSNIKKKKKINPGSNQNTLGLGYLIETYR